jgi:hypothetical protein
LPVRLEARSILHVHVDDENGSHQPLRVFPDPPGPTAAAEADSEAFMESRYSTQGKCFDGAIKEVKLPKYEKWANYEQFLPGNVERFCEYWGRGY